MFRPQPLLLLCRGQDADAQRLGQKQQIAVAGGIVALEIGQLHQAVDGEAKDGLGRVDTVAAGQGDAGLPTGLSASVDHGLRDFSAELVDGPAEDGDGHQRRAAHGVDIADGIGGGDPAKREGIIDDGHEKIGGRDQAAAIAQIDHRGIILALMADQKPRIGKAGKLALQNGVENFGGDFATATGAMAVLGQTDGICHRRPHTLKQIAGSIRRLRVEWAGDAGRDGALTRRGKQRRRTMARRPLTIKGREPPVP